MVLSEMPFDECSAAMSFQVGFKSVGFFFVFKGNRIFDAPRFVFCCVRNIAFIVFFQLQFLNRGFTLRGRKMQCFIRVLMRNGKQSHLAHKKQIRQQPLLLFSGHGVCGQDIWQKLF